MQYLLLGLYLCFTVGGLIFMKIGNNTGQFLLEGSNINFSISWISLIGFVLYILSFLLFTKIITTYDLTYIFPILTGIVQVISFILGYLIFKESISVYSVIGMVLIVLGIIAMNIKNNV